MRKFPVPFFLSVLLLGGCASVSVDRVETVSPAVRPDCIYVQEFVAPRGIFRVDRKGVSLEEFRTTMSRQLAQETASYEQYTKQTSGSDLTNLGDIFDEAAKKE